MKVLVQRHTLFVHTSHAWFLEHIISTSTTHTALHKSYTPHHTNTFAQCSWVTVEGPRVKITAYYFVCTVARLLGSPEVAVIDLSNPSFKHVILSLLLLPAVCQGDWAATQKILATMSKLTNGQNAAAVMNTATRSTSHRVLISQMSISTPRNNEYLMHLSLFRNLHSVYTLKGLASDSSCFAEHRLNNEASRMVQNLIRPYLKDVCLLFFPW